LSISELKTGDAQVVDDVSEIERSKATQHGALRQSRLETAGEKPLHAPSSEIAGPPEEFRRRIVSAMGGFGKGMAVKVARSSVRGSGHTARALARENGRYAAAEAQPHSGPEANRRGHLVAITVDARLNCMRSVMTSPLIPIRTPCVDSELELRWSPPCRMHGMRGQLSGRASPIRVLASAQPHSPTA